MEARTYRQPSCLAVIGIVISIVGAVISGTSGYHLATGIPLMQGDGKIGASVRAATPGELWFGIVGGMPVLLLGISFLMNAFNCTTRIDEQGIVATNMFGRPYFQAAWSEVSGVKPFKSGRVSGYEVVAGNKTLKLQTTAEQTKELVAEVQRRVGLAAGTRADA